MPNLVFIDCHDLGRHLGIYGWKTVPSPHLDSLARRGIWFENSFCTAPQCSPSRAGLYTGRYPHANGMLGLAHQPFNWRLHPGEIHLAGLLQGAGYATALIGAQHVTENVPRMVHKLGFDEVRLCSNASEVAEEALSYLAARPSKQFFLNIGFIEPHRDIEGRYTQAPPYDAKGVEIPPYLPETPEAKVEFTELQGVIRIMDEAVGKILAALSELDLIHDTWVIFTTDHGLAMPRAKCTLYDPGIQTALIMYAEPFGLLGGRIYHELISNVDILPTIVDMLGIKKPPDLQGRSFAALLKGLDYQPRDHVFAEKTFHTAYEPQRAIRSNHYKLIWNAEAGIVNVPGDIMHSAIYPQMIDQIARERPPMELYHLEQDPLEYQNLFDQAEYTEISQDLRDHLLQWMQETNDPILRGPVSSPFFDLGLRLLSREAG